MFYPFCQSVKWRNFNQSVLHQDKNLSNDRKKKRKKFFNRASAYYFQYSLVSENQMEKMFKTDETKRGKYNVNV